MAGFLAIFSSLSVPRLAHKRLPAALQSVPDQAYQGLIRKGFSQKPDCPGSQGLFLHPFGFMGGHENHRHVQARIVQVGLDLQAGHPRHLHVDHSTIRIR